MKRLVMIAGGPSHGPGAHEYLAGSRLLARCLVNVPGLEVEVHEGGWVEDDVTLMAADAVVMYTDGGAKHPLLAGDRLETMGRLAARGVGFGLMHWAVELPVGRGAPQVDALMGGHYEDLLSANPVWDARFDHLPEHPITRGVLPFRTRDEWYLNIRSGGDVLTNTAASRDGSRVTPILVATPTDTARQGPYVWPHGPYPEIVAASGRAETLSWVVERADGGRGFGIVGGHFHANWANDGLRTTALNALVWLAGAEVPPDGVASTVSADDLTRDLDPAEPQRAPQSHTSPSVGGPSDAVARGTI